jgi:ribosome-associated translation inhibitor RaiA
MPDGRALEMPARASERLARTAGLFEGSLDAKTFTMAKPADPMRDRDDIADGPMSIRTHVELTPEEVETIRAKLDQHLALATSPIVRGTVQFDHGRGNNHVEIVCRIKLVLEGEPAIVAEDSAIDPIAAFELAMPKITRVLEKARDATDIALRKRHHGRQLVKAKPETNQRRMSRPTEATVAKPGDTAGELIGRRVGHGPDALRRVLERPEKQRRDAVVDTAETGVSTSDRRAGGHSTARRNALARPRKSKQVAMLEDSRTKPSRKSTRRSATRTKQGTTKERSERGILYAPSSRNTLATARKGVPKRR